MPLTVSSSPCPFLDTSSLLPRLLALPSPSSPLLFSSPPLPSSSLSLLCPPLTPLLSPSSPLLFLFPPLPSPHSSSLPFLSLLFLFPPLPSPSLLFSLSIKVDALTKRSKAAETAFLTSYKRLIDLPDPIPILEQALAVQAKLEKTQVLNDTHTHSAPVHSTQSSYHSPAV